MVKIVRKFPDGNIRSLYLDGSLWELYQGFKKAVEKHNTSVVIVIDGRSGMGKTTLANQSALALDKKFDIHKIHYSPQTFMEGGNNKVGLANASAGDCILFDEAMLISNRSALSQINKMIIQAMSMIRSKRLYVIFCVNSVFDLDKNLAISRADLLLHVYGESLIKRGRFGAFFKGKDSRDRLKLLYLMGKKWYNYSKPKANFVGSFTKEFVVNEKDYEVQKQQGVNDFLKGTTGKQEARALFTRNNLINYLMNNEGWTRNKVMEVTGLSRAHVYRIMSDDSENLSSPISLHIINSQVKEKEGNTNQLKGGQDKT